MNEKIKIAELPLIVKMMIVFFILGWVWRIAVFGAYIIVAHHDSEISSITNELARSVCNSETNGSYPNYDAETNTCYQIYCKYGQRMGDDLSKCDREGIYYPLPKKIEGEIGISSQEPGSFIK